MIDLFITTKDRPRLLQSCLKSLRYCTDNVSYRLTIVQDGADSSTRDVILQNAMHEHLIEHRVNRGLGPSINEALSHIDTLKRWDTKPNEFTCYIQDDVIFTEGWLQTLERNFVGLEGVLKLGFATGVECIEHPIKAKLGKGMLTKDWIRATCMFARHDYWMSMWPISRIDPETGRERGRPNDGLGSSVDWWFIRNHKNSVCKTGRTNLVIPGLLKHAGYRDSTWLKRDLPESESDKEAIG